MLFRSRVKLIYFVVRELGFDFTTTHIDMANSTVVGGVTELQIEWDGFLILIAYLAILIIIGLTGFLKKKAEKETSMEDHYLAGGGLGLLVLFFTLFASTFSGWTLMGMPGDAYKSGMYAISWVSSFSSLYVAMLTVGPRIYRLARPRRWVTPSDYLFWRFNSHPVRLLSSVLMIIPTICYVLIQFKAMGEAVEGLSGGDIDRVWGAILLGVIMIIYETLGGMRGVCWAQVLQGLLLMICFGAFWVLQDVEFGGLKQANLWTQKHVPDKTAVLAGEKQASFMSLILIMLAFPLYPHQMVRYFAATSTKKLRTSVALLAFTAFFSFFSVCVLGWVAIRWHHAEAVNFPPEGVLGSEIQVIGDDKSDTILAVVCNDLIKAKNVGRFGYYVAVFLLTGALAAMMSTADAGLMAYSSMVSKDYVKPYIWRKASSQQLLTFSKLLIAGTIVCLIIISNINIDITGLAKLQQQMLLQAAPLIVVALYMEHLDGNMAFAGMASGIGTTVLLWFALGDPNARVRGLHCGLIGAVVNVIVMVGMNYWETVRPKEPGYVPYFNAAIRELNSSPRDEPLRHPWLFSSSLVLMAAFIPFYRTSGHQDGFVGALPAWTFITVIASLCMSLLAVIGAVFYWEDEPEMSRDEILEEMAKENVYGETDAATEEADVKEIELVEE